MKAILNITVKGEQELSFVIRTGEFRQLKDLAGECEKRVAAAVGEFMDGGPTQEQLDAALNAAEAALARAAVAESKLAMVGGGSLNGPAAGEEPSSTPLAKRKRGRPKKNAGA